MSTPNAKPEKQQEEYFFEDAYFEDGKVYLDNHVIGTVKDDGTLVDFDGAVIGQVSGTCFLEPLSVSVHCSHHASCFFVFFSGFVCDLSLLPPADSLSALLQTGVLEDPQQERPRSSSFQTQTPSTPPAPPARNSRESRGGSYAAMAAQQAQQPRASTPTNNSRSLRKAGSGSSITSGSSANDPYRKAVKEGYMGRDSTHSRQSSDLRSLDKKRPTSLDQASLGFAAEARDSSQHSPATPTNLKSLATMAAAAAAATASSSSSSSVAGSGPPPLPPLPSSISSTVQTAPPPLPDVPVRPSVTHQNSRERLIITTAEKPHGRQPGDSISAHSDRIAPFGSSSAHSDRVAPFGAASFPPLPPLSPSIESQSSSQPSRSQPPQSQAQSQSPPQEARDDDDHDDAAPDAAPSSPPLTALSQLMKPPSQQRLTATSVSNGAAPGAAAASSGSPAAAPFEESIFATKTAEECRWDEGMIEIQRLYLALKWLLDNKNFMKQQIEIALSDEPPAADEEDNAADSIAGAGPSEASSSRHLLVLNGSETASARSLDSGKDRDVGSPVTEQRGRALSYLQDDIKERELVRGRGPVGRNMSFRMQQRQHLARKVPLLITSDAGNARLRTLTASVAFQRRGSYDGMTRKPFEAKDSSPSRERLQGVRRSDVETESKENSLPVLKVDNKDENDASLRRRRKASLHHNVGPSRLREERKLLTQATDTRLGIKSFIHHPIDPAFVARVQLSTEYAEFERCFAELGDSDPVLRGSESKYYRELCRLLDRKIHTGGLLEVVAQRYGHSDAATVIFSTIKEMLAFLRQVESDPTTWHRGGFLHKVDNYLALLVFRRETREGLSLLCISLCLCVWVINSSVCACILF